MRLDDTPRHLAAPIAVLERQQALLAERQLEQGANNGLTVPCCLTDAADGLPTMMRIISA